ncbi:MAG: dienelactone hydrolase family protein [Jatrophihabitans sp.]|uniref:dienelactone hydrolase family protein n=1 Tax=Jatrophihabitans sp. TaxID=1932789 RepID=UPI0039169B95
MPDVEIEIVDGGSPQLQGYLAVPAGAGPWPGVVAIHESMGLNDIVRRQADRLAAAGYLTLAPDLYTDGGAARCLVATIRALLAGEGRAVADIDAARAELRREERCTGKVGVIGFCMGGGFALVVANRGWDAAAANYGQLPRHMEEALQGACPVVGNYGAKDLYLRGAGPKLARTLDRLGIENDIKTYPSAGHSFLNDRCFGPAPTHALQRMVNVGPDPEAAPDAWRRIESFFAEHLT